MKSTYRLEVPTKVDIRADPSSKELSKVTSVVCSDTMTAVLTSAGECVMFGVGRFVNGDQHDILEPLPVRQPALFDPVPCALCIC
jgi:alpha-tubulin suppressor-like RCC1 family protein